MSAQWKPARQTVRAPRLSGPGRVIATAPFGRVMRFFSCARNAGRHAILPTGPRPPTFLPDRSARGRYQLLVPRSSSASPRDRRDESRAGEILPLGLLVQASRQPLYRLRQIQRLRETVWNESLDPDGRRLDRLDDD